MPDKWFTLKRNATIHHATLISESIVIDLAEILGVGFKRHICVFRNNEIMNWHYDKTGMNAVAKFILRKTISKNNYNDQLRKKWNQSARALEKIFQQAERADLKNLADKDLRALYKNLKKNLKKESALGTLSDFLSSDLIKKELETGLKKLKIPHEDLPASLGIIATTVYKSPYGEEQKDLFKIAALYQARKNIGKELGRHAAKYWYSQNDYQFSQKLHADYFKKQIRQLLRSGCDPKAEIKKIEQKHRELAIEKNELIKKAVGNKQNDFIKIIKMVDVHGALWDLKKVMMQKAFYYLDGILSEIGRRLTIPLLDLKWFLPAEVDDLLAGNLKNNFAEEIKIRKNFCVLKITGQTVSVITGDKAKKTAEKIEGATDKNISLISGQIGSPGKVNGIATVVMNSRSKVKFPKGNILVTGMTTPDFIPLMKQAKAVVTDEGGMTCHAAIVSRELGIPCVIGTKIATKILKNGDRVEVDADKGIIKIIRM